MEIIRNIYSESLLVKSDEFGEVIITPSIYLDKDKRQLLVSYEEFSRLLKENEE